MIVKYHNKPYTVIGAIVEQGIEFYIILIRQTGMERFLLKTDCEVIKE